MRAADVIPISSPDFEATDLGNADRFEAEHNSRARYVVGWGWVLFDGQRWKVDDSNQVMKLAKQTVKAMPESDWRDKSSTRGRLKAMISLAQPSMTVPTVEFDADPMLLNTTVGTVRLDTGKIYPHKSSDFLTKQAEVGYSPTATAPLWNSFLEQVLPDKELRLYVQRAVGYSLTGSTSEQCLFFCLGRGRNGKSVFLETLAAMLGDYTCNSPTSTVMKKSGGVPNDIARLVGKRFVTLSETEQSQRFNEPLLKDLTGSDTVSGRFLFREYFDYKPQFKLWFRGNHQPVITGTDDGIWRRFHVIPFDVQIPKSEIDLSLPDKLKKELPGILNWAIKGCLEWQKSGLNPPGIVVDAVKQYRQESDVIGQFIEQRCQIGPNCLAPASSLYLAYREFAKENGEKVDTQTVFGRSLTARGFERKKTNIVFRLGIQLKH